MSFLGLFSGAADKRQNQQGMQKYGDRSDKSYRTFGEIMGDIQTQADNAYEEGDQTVDERFGDVLEGVTDQVNAQTSATQSNLTRANMATGGDVSGATSVGMAQAGERGSKAIKDAFRTYTQMNEQVNQRSKGRGDRLLSHALGSNQRQYQMDTGNMQGYELRELHRKQANRQVLADMLGTGMNVAGQAI